MEGDWLNGEERPYLVELFVAVLLSVFFATTVSEFSQGFTITQKILFYTLLASIILVLLLILGSIRGWALLSVYSLVIPYNKISELDNEWDKVSKKIVNSIFSLPKTTRFFPEMWLHKNVEHRNIEIFSRSIKNLNFLKDKLGIKDISQGRESIFRHLLRSIGTGNTNMYRYSNYRRYVAKFDWEDLRKKATLLKLELAECYEKTELRINKKDFQKESILDLEAHLKHGHLLLHMHFDELSNIHLFIHYFEIPSRQVKECIDTVEKNWKVITDSLNKVLEKKYVLKEKAGSEVSEEVIIGKRYLIMSSWGKIPKFENFISSHKIRARTRKSAS
jgi:hypothetical protein